jgi:hypothetical protein
MVRQSVFVPGQDVAQGSSTLQQLHQLNGEQAQALPGRQASRHPPLRRHHRRQPCGPKLARRHVNHPYGGHQPGVFSSPAGPRTTRSPQRRHHQRKARGGAQTRLVRPHLRGTRVYLVTFRARDDGRSSNASLSVVLALDQANARLGPAGGRARGRDREGHLFRASPGHDRLSRTRLLVCSGKELLLGGARRRGHGGEVLTCRSCPGVARTGCLS